MDEFVTAATFVNPAGRRASSLELSIQAGTHEEVVCRVSTVKLLPKAPRERWDGSLKHQVP